MTKEQAIEEINKAFEPAFANYIITALTKGVTVSDKALEQPTSDDCVSRAEAIKAITDTESYNETLAEAKMRIAELPPVTLSRKQGKWDKGYGYPDGAYWKCSCCNELIKVKIPMHFCSNCGAEMRKE